MCSSANYHAICVQLLTLHILSRASIVVQSVLTLTAGIRAVAPGLGILVCIGCFSVTMCNDVFVSSYSDLPNSDPANRPPQLQSMYPREPRTYGGRAGLHNAPMSPSPVENVPS